MIQIIDEKGFILHTAHTTYAFAVTDSGHLEHLYYGRRIHIKSAENIAALRVSQRYLPGNTTSYDTNNPNLTLEDLPMEISSVGKGDVREPMIELVAADGSTTCDFIYDSHVRCADDLKLESLPTAYGASERLQITLKDHNHGLRLELNYSVYENADCITRSVRLINTTKDALRIKRILSMQLDLIDNGYKVTSFTGAWAHEMNKNDVLLKAGKYVLSSTTGASSNRCNPFFMVSKENTDEDRGEVYGFNLIYSGNHYEATEVSSFGKTRIVTGINPFGFEWRLDSQESFETPEAVLSFSKDGYNGLSANMHTFVRNHIVRGRWKDEARPVLLNSWEANYFNINEKNLYALAKKAKEVGIELFVMDDGWFGERDEDNRSLGDWTVNTKKLPNGLKGISDKIRSLGLDFGIWIEPEMVNVNSDLYRAHPEWAIDIPGSQHSEGRNQRLLDFSNPKVVEYMTDCIAQVLKSADISYVKWDYNRNFSDVYSKSLHADRQGEVFHRYIMGLYGMMKSLTEMFPDILFEGCAAGGNRFDLGIMSYFPQVWTSDNTDAASRLAIQSGASYGYPMSVCSAHVSGVPNHQTLRKTPLRARFAVAAFGVLGYECNLLDLSKDELEEISEQIAFYKKYRYVFFEGDFYRHRQGNIYEWSVVSKNKDIAIGMVFEKETIPNSRDLRFTAKGLKPDVCYHFTSSDIRHSLKIFGDLVNTVAPIHIKQDSLVHNILDKHVPMTENGQDEYAYGDALMYVGINLHQGYAGTGFDDHVRVMTDFDARLYIMEEYR